MVSESPCGGEDMAEESLELCPSPTATMTNTKNVKRVKGGAAIEEQVI